MKTRKSKKTNLVKQALVLFLSMIMLPNAAFASNSAVGTIVNNLCEWLSGEVAAAIAVLVVIYSGYEMLHGDIDKMKFAVRAVAIGLIVGGSYITKNILLN